MIKPALAGAEVLIANYHAPTETNLEQTIKTLKSFGVVYIKLQKEVFNAELYFKLLSIASMGDLERMTQYKSASNPTAQLLTYPVLMAHDVVNYEEILVGQDQKQHLEYARRLLKKYNKKFKENVLIPKARIVGDKILDLNLPSRKMSKSFPEGCLFLDESPEEIYRKIRKSTMDEEGRNNLVFLFNEFVGKEVPESNLELKEELSKALVVFFEEKRAFGQRLAAFEEMVRLSQEMGLYD